MASLDQGHFNCRDYYLSPDLSEPMGRHPLYRHESFEELEQRSRSPASQMPKFPLLRLPLELRQQIFSYLLPRTQEFRDSGRNSLGEHARNFSAVKKRVARGLPVPTSNASASLANAGGISNVVWKRGDINLFATCKQLHDECAEMVYGNNTFLLFVTYAGITFRFRWLLPNSLAPSQSKDFIKEIPSKYLRLVKRIAVHVDHVDSYTGMIKFNVGGKGLTYGLRKQVGRLVCALRSTDSDGEEDEERRLAKINIRVSNGNSALDALKSDIVRQREGTIKVSEDLEVMLEPFGYLRAHEVAISGAVTDQFATSLAAKMRSNEEVAESEWAKLREETAAASLNDSNPGGVQLCVYGNDMA